jgi:hypothetical protein
MLGASLQVLWYAQARGPRTLFGAVKAGLHGRREVTALSTQDRRRIESKWLVKR